MVFDKGSFGFRFFVVVIIPIWTRRSSFTTLCVIKTIRVSDGDEVFAIFFQMHERQM
jgi:hypothetical protein